MNVREINKDGRTYVFVSRGAPVSDIEIDEYFGYSEGLEERVGPFIPDDRNRVRLFLKDIRNGLDFCSQKYGVTHDDVIAEAKRLAPHLKVTK